MKLSCKQHPGKGTQVGTQGLRVTAPSACPSGTHTTIVTPVFWPFVHQGRNLKHRVSLSLLEACVNFLPVKQSFYFQMVWRFVCYVSMKTTNSARIGTYSSCGLCQMFHEYLLCFVCTFLGWKSSTQWSKNSVYKNIFQSVFQG